MLVKSKRMAKIIVFALILCRGAGIAVSWALGNLSKSSSFGEVALRLPDGSTVYVVRESWGLHSDQIAISQNPDGCDPAKTLTDYIDKDTHSLIYSQSSGRLTVYENAAPYTLHRPLNPWKNDSIVIATAINPSWGDLRSEPGKYGAVVLNVPLNEFCWSHLLRPTSSLRPNS